MDYERMWHRLEGELRNLIDDAVRELDDIPESDREHKVFAAGNFAGATNALLAMSSIEEDERKC